jgi:hypothetical protein
MAEEKKKKKEKSALDYFSEAYDTAAKSGVLGTRAKVTAEEKGKGSEWYTGKKKKKSE